MVGTEKLNELTDVLQSAYRAMHPIEITFERTKCCNVSTELSRCSSYAWFSTAFDSFDHACTSASPLREGI